MQSHNKNYQLLSLYDCKVFILIYTSLWSILYVVILVICQQLRKIHIYYSRQMDSQKRQSLLFLSANSLSCGNLNLSFHISKSMSSCDNLMEGGILFSASCYSSLPYKHSKAILSHILLLFQRQWSIPVCENNRHVRYPLDTQRLIYFRNQILLYLLNKNIPYQ